MEQIASAQPHFEEALGKLQVCDASRRNYANEGAALRTANESITRVTGSLLIFACNPFRLRGKVSRDKCTPVASAINATPVATSAMKDIDYGLTISSETDENYISPSVRWAVVGFRKDSDATGGI